MSKTHPYAVHPLAQLFPEVRGKSLTDLVTDIKDKGLLNPIVTHEKQIVDGRNRLKACKEAGVTPRFVTFHSLGLKCSVADFIWSQNIERRQLTPDQRAVISFEWASALRAKARENQKLGGMKKPVEPIRTRAAIAERAQVTEHRIQQAEKVVKLTPKLVPAIKSGKMKLKDAVKVADKHKPQPKRADAVTGFNIRWGAALADLFTAATLLNNVAIDHQRLSLTQQQTRELESLARKILAMRKKIADKHLLAVRKAAA